MKIINKIAYSASLLIQAAEELNGTAPHNRGNEENRGVRYDGQIRDHLHLTLKDGRIHMEATRAWTEGEPISPITGNLHKIPTTKLKGPEMDRVYIIDMDEQWATILTTSLTKINGYGIGHLARESSCLAETNARINITEGRIWIEATKTIKSGDEIIVNSKRKLNIQAKTVVPKQAQFETQIQIKEILRTTIQITPHSKLTWQPNKEYDIEWEELRTFRREQLESEHETQTLLGGKKPTPTYNPKRGKKQTKPKRNEQEPKG